MAEGLGSDRDLPRRGLGQPEAGWKELQQGLLVLDSKREGGVKGMDNWWLHVTLWWGGQGVCCSTASPPFQNLRLLTVLLRLGTAMCVASAPILPPPPATHMPLTCGCNSNCVSGVRTGSAISIARCHSPNPPPRPPLSPQNLRPLTSRLRWG